MRETIQIPLDEIGIISNVDLRDTGENSMIIKQSDKREIFRKIDNYAAYTKNIEPNALRGRLQPIKGLGQTTSSPNLTHAVIAGKIFKKSNWIKKIDGKYSIVYDNGTDIRIIEDFYGTPSAVSGYVTGPMKCSAAFNQGLHIGTGLNTSSQWIGYNSNNLFGGIGLMEQDVDVDLYSGSKNILVVGNYTGATNSTLYVKINDVGKFQWKIGSGGTYSAQQDIISDFYLEYQGGIIKFIELSDGLFVSFPDNAGYYNEESVWVWNYDVGDIFKWTLTAKSDILYSSVPIKIKDFVGNTAGKIAITDLTPILSETTSNWKSNKLYTFKYSLEFDGYQETELIGESKRLNLKSGSVYKDASKVAMTITLYGANTLSNFNRRLTALNLYMAESLETSTDANVLSESAMSNYRLIARVPFSTILSKNEMDYNNGVISQICGSANKYIGFSITAPFNTSVTYEENTGRSEELKNPYLNYELSCATNNYHFVARAYHPELKELAANMLFRSGLSCFDTFNWATDFVGLPFIPLQITAYNNKVFVFGTNQIIQIDAVTLAIEKTIDGIGIVSDLEVLVNDKGMFWFDKNGIYIYDGKEIIDISLNIYDSANYKSFNNTLRLGSNFPKILYSSEKKGILFVYVTYDGVNKTLSGWFYHLEKLEWYYWELMTADYFTNYYLFNGKDGEIFVNAHITEGADSATYKMFASSQYLASTFISKKYDIGLQNQDKKFYKIKYSGNPGTVTYDVNDSTSLNKTLSSYALSSENRKAKNIQIKVETNASNSLYYLETLEIIYRQLVGMR